VNSQTRPQLSARKCEVRDCRIDLRPACRYKVGSICVLGIALVFTESTTFDLMRSRKGVFQRSALGESTCRILPNIYSNATSICRNKAQKNCPHKVHANLSFEATSCCTATKSIYDTACMNHSVINNVAKATFKMQAICTSGIRTECCSSVIRVLVERSERVLVSTCSCA